MKRALGFCLLFFGLLALGWGQGTAGNQPVLLSPTNRGPVVSPNGKWELTVWGQKDEVQWLMLGSKDATVRYRVQVWPINDAAYVLWRPDGKAFAFADVRLEDKYLLYVDRIRGYLQSELTDLTPPVRDQLLRSFGKRYEVLRWYVKPLLWANNRTLLVGVECVTTRRVTPPPQHRSAQNWLRGYLVDIDRGAIVGNYGAGETKTRFGVNLKSEKW